MKIIQILSVGHSGSTLLDIMLGQFPNTFSTGELKHLTWQYYRQITNNPTTQKCTCGKNFDECDVWSQVITDLSNWKHISEKSVPEKVIIKHFDSLSFFDKSKKHKLLRALYKWNITSHIIPPFVFKMALNEINSNNIQLYRSIEKTVPNIDYIIDSSKDIIKYNELRNHIQIFPIILIRDINDIMKSKYVTAPVKTKQVWRKYYNKQVLSLLKNQNDRDFQIISYEMFINNPRDYINELANKLDIDASKFNLKVSMNNTHIVAGNPMRYQEEITINQKEFNKATVIQSLKESGLDNFFTSRI